MLVFRFTIPILFIILLCPWQTASAQEMVSKANASSKLIKQLESAQDLLASGEAEKALDKLDKLISSEPGFIDAVILRGEALFRSGKTSDAIGSLERAIEIDSLYDPRVLFTLSRLQESEMQYLNAASNLEAYARLGAVDDSRREEILEFVDVLEFRQELVSNPVSFDPVPLPGDVNTINDEALPAVAIDGLSMIFTRRERGTEDMFEASWDSTSATWKETRGMYGINSPLNEGAHTVSANGRVLVFTSCNRRDGVGSCDLYLTFQNASGEWSEVRNLTSINSRGWDGQPALTADGRGLYFSSDRPGGSGKRDIWFAVITDSGWTDPINLGPVVNTSGNESSPFIHRDDRTMYFMSDGHPGMGDYDLFITRKRKDDWTPPLNLGYPVNTPSREGALTVHPNGRMAYYTRQDLELGTMDIYEFELPQSAVPDAISYLEIRVVDSETDQPVTSLAWIYELADTTKRDRYVSTQEGRIDASLPHGGKYGLHITAPGYVFYSDQFDLDVTQPYGKVAIKVPLKPIVEEEVGAGPIVLHNIEFETGSSSLLPSSKAELNLLYELMASRPDLRIEIRGHTDNVGEPEDNLVLSTARARSVYNWLINKGVDEQRVEYMGYGETEPVSNNETEMGRQQNRRTEFEIIN